MARHWLELVARRAQIPYAQDLLITPGADTAQAWQEACGQLRLDEGALAGHISGFFHLPLADLAGADPSAGRLIPEKLIRQYNVVPLRHTDREITVATFDPGDLGAEQALGFAAGRTPVFEVATPSDIGAAIAARFARDEAVSDIVSRVDNTPAGFSGASSIERELEGARAGESAAVAKLTQLILQESIARRASDVAVYPSEAGGVVELRVDGAPRHLMNLPRVAMNHVVNRLRVLGQTGMADRSRSRDGSAELDWHGAKYLMRIRTTAAHGTSRADIRLTDTGARRSLEDLQLPARELDRLRSAMRAGRGLVVIAGPLGSGRTTLRYALLRALIAAGERPISIEELITEELPDAQQVEIAAAQGMTAAKLVETAARRESIVLALDELADAATARLLADAAADRLVVVVVRATNTLDALARLANLGLDRARLGTVVAVILALRLVRQLCRSCALLPSAPATELERGLAARWGVAQSARAAGCAACDHTGYRGVLPLAETLIADDAFRKQILGGASLQELGKAAVAGGARSLRAGAIDRVRSAETDLAEVERVLGGKPLSRPAAPKPTILIADDEPETRMLARAVLEQAGFAVAEAADGQEVLERAGRSTDFAMLILDLNMPRLDGRETLARLKQRVETAALPVLVLTASADPADERGVLEAGAEDYVRKPLDPERFMARVRAILLRRGVEVPAHG